MKMTSQTHNNTTINEIIFSSKISLVQSFTQCSCPVHLTHPGSSHAEECAPNKLVLPKSLNMYSQNPWNITILPVSFQQRFGLLACKLTKKEEEQSSPQTILRTPLKLWVFSLCI